MVAVERLAAIQASLKRLDDIQSSLGAMSMLIVAQIDMNGVEVLSTTTDREFHHKTFEQEIVTNYKCEDNIKHDGKLRCVVTNHFHRATYVCRAAHLIPLSQRSKMEMIGLNSSSDVWNWRNGLCLHKEIYKRFELMELVKL